MGYQMPWYSATKQSADALLAGRWFGMLACYLRDSGRVFETYWTTDRGAELMTPAYGLLDLTVYGWQESFEDSRRAGRSTGRTTAVSSAQTGVRARSGHDWPPTGLRSDDLTA